MLRDERELLLTVEETMKKLKVGRNTLYKLIHQNELPAIRVMGKWRIPVISLDKYISDLLSVKNKGMGEK